MTPMVGTGAVPHLGRLACAYFHSSAHPSDKWAEKLLTDSRVTDPHLSLCVGTDRYQMLRIFPMDSCR